MQQTPKLVERFFDLLSSNATNAKCMNCTLMLSHLWQFFLSGLLFSEQAKLRYTTQRLGITLKL